MEIDKRVNDSKICDVAAWLQMVVLSQDQYDRLLAIICNAKVESKLKEVG